MSRKITTKRENEDLKEMIRLSQDAHQTKESAMKRENEDLKERKQLSQDAHRTKESAMKREIEKLREIIRLSQDTYRTKAMKRENEDLKARIQLNQGEYQDQYPESNRLQSRLKPSKGNFIIIIINIKSISHSKSIHISGGKLDIHYFFTNCSFR